MRVSFEVAVLWKWRREKRSGIDVTFLSEKHALSGSYEAYCGP